MPRLSSAALLAGLLAAPGLALAQAPAATTLPAPVTAVQSVADLAAICDPAPGPLRLESIAYCQGYLTAAGQYHAAIHPAVPGSTPLFCPPSPPPTVAQSGLAFAAWARQNPAHASEPALDGLMRWAQVTYPCPQPAAPARPRR